MKKTMLLILLTILFQVLTADYLEVRRSATIKKATHRDAEILARAAMGDYLELLNEGRQEYGYYFAKIPGSDIEGYIYRTLVRGYRGEIPGLPEVETFSYYFDPVPGDYYQNTSSLYGDELREKLHEIIDDHREYNYDQAWEILMETDRDSLNADNVICIYSGFSIPAEIKYDDGNGWTREHVWAKSYGDFGTRKGAGTDVHHLRPEDVSTNSARRNRSFDESEQLYIDTSGTYSGPTSSKSGAGWTWEPRDEVKGDVARMLFYMAVRYEGDSYEPDLELVDFNTNKDSKLPQHGRLSTLLQWHQQDPVDNLERYRNHIIYTKYQYNRNPFIDHPEFVERIWGDYE